MTGKPIGLRSAMLAATLLACTTAHADNADLDAPGPGARSTISLGIGSYQSKFDYQSSPGITMAGSKDTTRAIDIGATIALHEDLNIDVYTSHDRNRSEVSAPGLGTISDERDTSGFYGVTLSGRLVGTRLANGFGLVGMASLNKMEGSSKSFDIAAQPQYRFDGQFVGVLNIGYGRDGDESTTWGATASLIAKLSPDISLMPYLGWQRISPELMSKISGQHAGVAMSYHFNRNLSVQTTLSTQRFSDYDTGLYTVHNLRGTNMSARIRWAF